MRMFRPAKSHLTNSTAPLITARYQAILSDDVDILFIGENVDGQKIVGTSVEWDGLTRVWRSFHVVLSDEEMSQWFDGHKSYRELLESARPLYIVDRGEDVQVYEYLLNEIPENYYPARDTYYKSDWDTRLSA